MGPKQSKQARGYFWSLCLQDVTTQRNNHQEVCCWMVICFRSGSHYSRGSGTNYPAAGQSHGQAWIWGDFIDRIDCSTFQCHIGCVLRQRLDGLVSWFIKGLNIIGAYLIPTIFHPANERPWFHKKKKKNIVGREREHTLLISGAGKQQKMRPSCTCRRKGSKVHAVVDHSDSFVALTLCNTVSGSVNGPQSLLWLRWWRHLWLWYASLYNVLSSYVRYAFYYKSRVQKPRLNSEWCAFYFLF